VASGGGDQAIEQIGVFDLVAPAERLYDALHMAPTLADILDKVEVLVWADLLDTDQHVCWPDRSQDTTQNRRASSKSAARPGIGGRVFSPQF
jgi:hypothetical protein